MRIDELDPKHVEFKEVILDHELTEEQLDEILPVIGAVAGGIARGAAAVGNAALRGVGAAARGLAGAARVAGNAVGTGARAVGNTARQTGNAVRTANNARKAVTQNTQNTQGTQGTIGSQGSEPTQQASLERGQEVAVPQPDPKDPKKSVMTTMKVKNVGGRDVELEPKKKQPGVPSSIKYAKKDLAF